MLPRIPKHELMVSGILARNIAAALADRGKDAVRLLGIAGIPKNFLQDPDMRLPALQQAAFTDAAEKETGDPLLIFHVGTSFDIRQTGVIYYVIASEQTLGSGLTLASQYFPVESDTLRQSVVRDNGKAAIVLSDYGVSAEVNRTVKEFAFTGLLRIMRYVATGTIRPVAVQFEHKSPGPTEDYETYFQCPVTFGAPRTEIVFDTEVFERPVVSRDPYLRDIMVRFIERLRSERRSPPSSLTGQIESIVLARLPQSVPAVGEIAKLLGMSRRTLERSLASEGTSVTQIVTDIRKRLAVHYLEDSSRTVSEIAWLLGFSDVSSFTHAFHREFGEPPSSWRNARKSDGD